MLLGQAAPASYQVLIQRGLAALEAGQLEAAEAAFQQARDLQPQKAAANYQLGEVYSRRGQTELAITHFRRAIQLEPSEPESYLRLATLELQLRRFHDAEQTLHALLRRRAKYPVAYFMLGRVAAETDDYALAEKQLREYVRLRPGDAKGLGELGMVLLRAEKTQEGEALSKRALAIDPNLGLVHYNLGLSYELRGDHSRSKSHLIAAVRLLPTNADAHYQLGIVLLRLGQLEDAETTLRKALELSPDHLEALYALGSVLRQMGRSQEASEVLAEHERRSAASLEQRQRDRRVSAYHMEVRRLLEENSVGDAEEKLAEILRLDPQNDLAYYRQGQIAFLRHDYVKALELAGQATALKGFEPAYHQLQGMSLERLGRDQEAAAAYRHVLDLADYSEAHVALAGIATRKGEARQAVAHLERAVALEPKDPDVRLALADALARAGDQAGSRRQRALAESLRGAAPPR
ncbi:MAG TPA: tetratricopeptide repeat protein [Terriglobales bacterium]|nr:tetratricopeptide repeat protein [Terriglobales bacterium]